MAEHNYSIFLLEKRFHTAGNAHDEFNNHEILIHPYGPHIFHTQSKRVFNYLSHFTNWRSYEHKVRAMIDGKLLPIPINRTTINLLYDLNLTEEETALFLKQARENITEIKTGKDVVLNTVGRDLYEKFFKNYTLKQWGLSPAQLDSSVLYRIPVRTNTDDRYFTDKYQVMPRDGYTKLFENLLDHKNIQVELGVNFFDIRDKIKAKHIIYTGPIDEFYGYCYGRLPYRSLRFEHEHFPDINQYQPVGVVNYPNDHDYTRITEFKHLTGQQCNGTSICREYPRSHGDPYYPIPRPENEQLYRKYERLAQKETNVSFLGRLARYRYINMDQAVAEALELADHLLGIREV